MLWKLFQLTIMAAVMCGNIYYEWTPNGYLVGLLGLGAAFIATWLLSGFCSLFGRRSAQLREQATNHHKSTVGARWDTNNLINGVPRTWVRDEPSNLIEIPSKTPRLEGIVGEVHPLPRGSALSSKRRQPLIGH